MFGSCLQRLKPCSGLGVDVNSPLATARTFGDRLAIIGDSGRTVAFQLVGAAASSPGVGLIKAHENGPIQIDKCLVNTSESQIDPPACIEKTAVVRGKRYSLLRIGEGG